MQDEEDKEDESQLREGREKDYTSMSVRHHEIPQSTLNVPDDETFPVPHCNHQDAQS